MIEEVCRPVVFEQDDEEFPYWGKGSSFLVSNEKNYYWVTADHVIQNLGGSADSVLIFPTDNSRVALPFNLQARIKRDESDPKEFEDIVVLRIDLPSFQREGDQPLSAQDIVYGAMPAEDLNKGDDLAVIGYPSECRAVDYEDCKIKYHRKKLSGIYAGQSSIGQYCHELHINDLSGVNDCDGLSGAPIFNFVEKQCQQRRVIVPTIVGIVLRGGSESNILHFVSANVLINVIRKSEC